MRILIAMSGGVDSSVVAHLLKQQGHDLVGVRLELWNDPSAPSLAQVLPNKCCNAQTQARARAVAQQLDIPLHTVDVRRLFKEKIVDYFLETCANGQTPNPCVECNKILKFGALLDIADTLECEKVATGHYARIEEDADSIFHLREAADQKKDQSYYLYRLTQSQLSHVLFPLGTLKKSDVYALAKQFLIPLEEEQYRETQNICFFPEKHPTAFLRRHLKGALMAGTITLRDGTVVGTHQGLALATVGQRRIGIGGLSTPLEVVAKDVDQNRLIVAACGEETVQRIAIRDFTWTTAPPEENISIVLECRTRSLSPRKKGTLTYHKNHGMFVFTEPQSPLAPGQSLVLYDGDEIVGGGIMH